MRRLAIDIETYSDIDLTSSGVYRYTESPEFCILLMAYQEDDREPEIVDLASGEEIPGRILDALASEDVTKTAWNAAFERVCLERGLQMLMPPEEWECTMVHAANAGLPLQLDAAASALKLPGKSPEGKALIKYFSMPCKPTKVNGGRIRNLPEHAPEKWQAFKDYCLQDVRTERAIGNRIQYFKIPAREKALWNLDQKINDTGILLDRTLVRQAIYLAGLHAEALQEQARELTGLANPNSVTQLKAWLEETGTLTETLTKADVKELLGRETNELTRKVLRIRQENSRTSIKKYQAMDACQGRDGRARGLLQFYGANRTGRWAGRLIQVQNLPQNHISALDTAREIVKDGDLELLEMLYESPSEVTSQLIRTAFIAPPGRILAAVDFSAIEARVIAWLAGERWRLDVFASHGKIYEASAAEMFRVPIQEVDKKMRAKGKIAELALGYGGGVGALLQMGAVNMGLQEDELPGLVNAWRRASPRIVRLWTDTEDAAITALKDGYCPAGRVKFYSQDGTLQIQLPSGRRLCYQSARIDYTQGRAQVTYQGMDQTTKQWTKQRTYGGKLVENITQAVARDLLAEAMLRLDAAGFKQVMHVHDEIVIEGQPGDKDRAVEIMRQAPAWAKGLPLDADGFEAHYYQK
jgi:DNA polymerase